MTQLTMKKKQDRPDAKYLPKGTTQTARRGDAMITSTTLVGPARIDYTDILNCTEVVADERSDEAPWEACDGWEHEFISSSKLENRWPYNEVPSAVYWEQQGYVAHTCQSDSGLIVISEESADEWFGATAYRGASKQVNAEYRAARLREAYAQLKKWYVHGWQWYGVVCEFLGEIESLWGIDDEEYAEKYVVAEIAEQMVDRLEELGYTVHNQPATVDHSSRTWKQRRLRNDLARKLGFDDLEAYRRWLTAEEET